MRFLALALMGTTTLFVGTASAAVSSASQSDMTTLTAVSVADQTMTARQGRGGHGDPPGDDHDGLVVIAKQGRGGHDDTGRGGDNNPGDDDLVAIG